MIASNESGTPNWAWGSPRQLWACRVGHVLGLIAVLALLFILSTAPTILTDLLAR
jgi:hypothetical protein